MESANCDAATVLVETCATRIFVGLCGDEAAVSYSETVHITYVTEKVIKIITRLLGAAQYNVLKFLKRLSAGRP